MPSFARRFWTAAAALAPALAYGACAANTDRVLDVTYDPCATEVAAPAATADERASLQAALVLWNERGGFRLTMADAEDARDAGAPSPLPVHFQVEFGAFRGFYDDESGEVIVQRELAGDARTIVIAHELGHAFGLWHVESSARRSVMNPRNTTIAPLPADVDAVRALWGRCE